jgi:hypothetical protein
VSSPTGAVFLSYASEDSEAAARIAQPLEAADIQVWFDRSALRGGDAWDASISQQIRGCASSSRPLMGGRSQSCHS